jgi:hypothetical protein
MIRFGAAQRPLRTGRCRVRELRCSFTIATFSREQPLGERLSRFSPRDTTRDFTVGTPFTKTPFRPLPWCAHLRGSTTIIKE